MSAVLPAPYWFTCAGPEACNIAQHSTAAGSFSLVSEILQLAQF